MMKYAFLIFFFSIISLNLLSQNISSLNSEFDSEQRAVFATVMNVFKGMHLGDSTMVKKSFARHSQAFTIFEKGGKTIHLKDNLQKFFDVVGTPHENIWNEYSWNYQVKIDGSLAQVWCDYAFYIDDTFSHCGVDAFQLVKIDNDWKIFVLSDTRRKELCVVPAYDKLYAPK